MKAHVDPASVCESLDGDGCIEPDSPAGRALGFTSDLFDGWLWKTGRRVTVSFIESKQPGRGHVRSLFDRIEKDFDMEVPTPLGRMTKILLARGFAPTIQDTPLGDCEIWTRRPREEP